MTALDLVARHEGWKPQVYCDRCGRGLLKTAAGWQCGCPLVSRMPGNLTVGIGTRVDGPGITQHEARAIASARLDQLGLDLDMDPDFERLDEVRQAAILDMAYNLGVDGVLGFERMWERISDQDWPGASYEVLHSEWARQVPARAAEIAHIILTGEWPLSPAAAAAVTRGL